MLGQLLGIAEKFIPDKDKREEFKAQVEKERLNTVKSLMGPLIERGTIPFLIYIYGTTHLLNGIILPLISMFTDFTYIALTVDPNFDFTMRTLLVGLLGKKVIDKKVKK